MTSKRFQKNITQSVMTHYIIHESSIPQIKPGIFYHNSHIRFQFLFSFISYEWQVKEN